GTRALFLGFEGGGERQTAALLFLARLGALGLRRHDGASRHAGTAHRTRTFVLVRFLAAHGGCGLAQTLLGRGFGLFARFLFGLAALFFLALARFGGVAVGGAAHILGGAAARVFLGLLPVLALARAGVGKRA